MEHFVSPPLMTVPDVLSAAECQAYIAWSEGLGYTDAPVSLPGGAVHRPDLRDNARVMVDDPDRAAALWARLAAAVPPTDAGVRATSLNERLRFYRYRRGERFLWHTDGSYRRSAGERSLLTLMIYLNDVEHGGLTEFESISILPVAGTALLFEHMLPHQGAPVLAGQKYVLRTDVMYPVVD